MLQSYKQTWSCRKKNRKRCRFTHWSHSNIDYRCLKETCLSACLSTCLSARLLLVLFFLCSRTSPLLQDSFSASHSDQTVSDINTFCTSLQVICVSPVELLLPLLLGGHLVSDLPALLTLQQPISMKLRRRTQLTSSSLQIHIYRKREWWSFRDHRHIIIFLFDHLNCCDILHLI